MGKVDCYKCRYYHMTWDTKFPHSCMLLEFRSRAIPSIVAYKATGADCVGFEPKDGYKGGRKKGRGTSRPGPASQTDHVIVDIREKK